MKTLNKIEQKAVSEFKQSLTKELGSNLVMIQLFGSKARGDFHSESDIDLFIVVNKNDKRTNDIISTASYNSMLKYRELLSPVVYSQEKYQSLKNNPTSFLFNVLNEGIKL